MIIHVLGDRAFSHLIAQQPKLGLDSGRAPSLTSYQQIASALLDNSNCDPNTGIIIRGRSYWENPAELENSLTALLEEWSTGSTL